MSGCTDCLKTHVLHKAVYMLIDDLNGRDGSVRRVGNDVKNLA
jgi:hypothetical protein